MIIEGIDFAGFEGRKKELLAKERYIHEKTPMMIYRTNLWMHSLRVLWHLEAIADEIRAVYGQGFDMQWARTYAIVHDDAEIITGDVQLYDKERMTVEELDSVEKNEERAIDILCERFPETLNGYSYRNLLEAALTKPTIESQVVSYCDKFDGASEAWHEVWAGNKPFLQAARDYIQRFEEFPTKYQGLNPLLRRNHPMFLPPNFDFDSVKGQDHKDRIFQTSGYAPYDFWKRTIILRGEISSLLIHKEGL
jgi:5'-deoxynucleotidase YfbR-like HD superfamily hydrolase